MTQSVRDLESTFARAFALLAKDWFIIVPGLVLGVLDAALHIAIGVFVVGAFYLSGNGSSAVAEIAKNADIAISQIADTLVAIAQMAFVIGMAGSAWLHGGSTSFSDGWSAFRHRWLQVFLAGALLLVIGACAYFLSPYTFYVPLIAYMVFFLYTLTAVIIGERGAVAAIVESCGLAFTNIVPTLSVVGLVIVAAVVGGTIDRTISGFSATAGGIAHAVLLQVVFAYASLVVTGEYLKLRALGLGRIPDETNGV